MNDNDPLEQDWCQGSVEISPDLRLVIHNGEDTVEVQLTEEHALDLGGALMLAVSQLRAHAA